MGLRVVHRADQRLDGPFAGHSGTSLNLQTKTNQEAAKDIYLNVRCVKNYTK